MMMIIDVFNIDCFDKDKDGFYIWFNQANSCNCNQTDCAR
jgi:hypothetical protein